jgi:hypothetical protein
MKKLNNLANAINKATDKTYARRLESMEVSKPNPYNEHLNKTKGER